LLQAIDVYRPVCAKTEPEADPANWDLLVIGGRCWFLLLLLLLLLLLKHTITQTGVTPM